MSVELRKVVVTRNSQILLGITIGLGLLISALITIFGSEDLTQVDLALPILSLTAAVALGMPLIGVLIMTSDWQSREIMTIFLLQPRRGVVFAAKVVASVCLSLLLIAAVIALSVAFVGCVVLFTHKHLVYDTALSAIGPLLVVCVVGTLTGSALASVILNTPMAIIAVIAQAVVIDPLTGLLPRNLGSYLSSSSLPDYLSGQGTFGQGVTSLAIWIVLPLVLGLRRTRLREVG